MKLTESAQSIASRVAGVIDNDVQLITSKQKADEYGRTMPEGCYLLRVHIVANPDVPAQFGTMTLFVPMAKKAIKAAPDLVYASVLEYIKQAAEYRAAQYGIVLERVAA